MEPDRIHPRVLNKLSSNFSKPLTAIFNKSLESASRPKIWKPHNISPIFKKGNRALASQYRPVSLTCICSKILESILCKID